MLSTDGVTYNGTDTTGDGTDTSGDGGSIWTSVFDNAGSILTGGAAVLNAVKGTTPGTKIVTGPATTPTSGAGLSTTWMLIIGLVFLILIVFLVLKK
jgi:hypothetical protein